MHPRSHLHFGLDDPVISTLYLKLFKRLVCAEKNTQFSSTSSGTPSNTNLSDPSVRVSFRHLVHEAVKDLHPAHGGLGLRYGEHLSLIGADTLGQLLMSCSTVKEAMYFLHKYRLLLGLPCDFCIEQAEHDEICVVLHLFPHINPSPVPEVLNQFITEAMVSVFLKQVEWLTGKHVAFTRLDFAYSKPAHSQLYLETFDCHTHFDQARTSMTLKREILNYPIKTADDDIKEFKLAQCEVALRKREKHFAIEQRLQAIFQYRFPNLPTAEEAAALLELSKSALARKLQESGLSFQRVLNDFKRKQSEQLLAQTNYTISEIAERIGFSDSSTFRRAFKTWTGLQPSQIREKHQAEKK